MHIMNDCHVYLDKEGCMKILEEIKVSEEYISLKGTFSINIQESLYVLEKSRNKRVQKNDPNCPCIFMKRSW